MSAWEYICYAMAIAYAALILVYFVAWLLIPRSRPAKEYSPVNAYSILIAARNEEAQIEACLQAIIAQNYPPNLFEILVLNDHSTDKTGEKVAAIIKRFPSHAIYLVNATEFGFSGKKNAIELGVEKAKFPYIILSDADCTRGENWLKAIDAFVQERNCSFVYAPVFFSSSNLFERFQSLEFAGLVGIGGAAIHLQNPNMCSAANLIFKKEAFVAVNGYADNVHLASGDDEFLLHKIFKKYPKEVFFLKNRDAVVYTTPNASVDQLAQQRRRWVSKSTKYENRYITAILVGAYFFNLSIFVNLVLGFWYPALAVIGIGQLLIKMFAEASLIGSILLFFNKIGMLFLVPLVQPFHIVYVIVIGIWANIKTYTWKERELK